MNDVSCGAAAYSSLEPLHHSFRQAVAGSSLDAARGAGEALLNALDETRRETLYTLFRHCARHGSELVAVTLKAAA